MLRPFIFGLLNDNSYLVGDFLSYRDGGEIPPSRAICGITGTCFRMLQPFILPVEDDGYFDF